MKLHDASNKFELFPDGWNGSPRQPDKLRSSIMPTPPMRWKKHLPALGRTATAHYGWCLAVAGIGIAANDLKWVPLLDDWRTMWS